MAGFEWPAGYRDAWRTLVNGHAADAIQAETARHSGVSRSA